MNTLMSFCCIVCGVLFKGFRIWPWPLAVAETLFRSICLYSFSDPAMASKNRIDHEWAAHPISKDIGEVLLNFPYELESWENVRNVCLVLVAILGNYLPLIDFWVAITRGQVLFRGMTEDQSRSVSRQSMGVRDLEPKEPQALLDFMEQNRNRVDILYADIAAAIDFLDDKVQGAHYEAAPETLKRIMTESSSVFKLARSFMKKHRSN